MEKAIKELLDHQSRSERLKNFPYPRQYAIVNALFIRLFCILLPFGMLKEFDALHRVWLVIPFSVLISWIYTLLQQIGESTENRFEGGANDVPIAQIARMVEVELRKLLGDADQPTLLRARSNIIL